MSDTQYLAAKTIDEAVQAHNKANGSARFLAGGTDLLVQIKSGIKKPNLVIDVKKILELNNIEEISENEFVVGASVSGANLNRNKKFSSLWPGVIEAFRLIGSEQIQGRASLGGNLCNGSPAGDSVPALIAAGCTAVIAGPDGKKELPIEEFHTGPGKTILKNGEMLVSLKFPKRESNSSDSYLRMTPRTEMDIAVVGCGVNLTLDNDICTSVRVSLGAVAPTPLLIKEASDIMIGTNLNSEVLEKVARICMDSCNPINDKRGTIEYRTKVAGVLFKRATLIAIDRIKGK
ncbi:xanthine dehydrogenase family protein subunit M [Alphaproteobacteria bacterium]|nr:xanthine dehydrogenase family protein subunit M [Alphaproteobacteria bacterium]MDC1086308.1 xanthine dehydrogenase family protein subunit M [Alphaproteobacteria bacterium]